MDQRVKIAVIGAGFAGIGMAVQLKRAGYRDFIVLERGNTIGGTWRDNTYPGAACDIRSDLYSFSFNPNPMWENSYGRQPEILEYLQSTVRKFEIGHNLLLGCDVTSAHWDSEACVWRIRTGRGCVVADVLISGAGPLIDPVWPEIAGIHAFAGDSFHSARWDHGVRLDGKKIAVIGTGASAIQFVPELQKVAAQLTVFQRTPAWIVPRQDRPTSAVRRSLFRRCAALQKLSRQWIFTLAESRLAGFRSKTIGGLMQRFARGFIEREVSDPVLRSQLTPHYRIGCKRILVSSNFYPAVTKNNVTLVTDALVGVTGRILKTSDGAERDFDVLIAGTGFNATEPPIARIIHNAKGESLAAHWAPHMHALHGTTVSGFPNLFLLVGPNTALGHNSIVYMIESQIHYILQALDLLKRTGARHIEPNENAQTAYNELLQRDLAGSVWVSGGCTSYYLDSAGKNTTLWPHRAASFRRSLRRLDLNEYILG